MYLKSIEVHGFKSFYSKLLFEFHDGITGIVGPNGSGKSNVADAVRWVLGEQSAKQLRGSKMEDVIFAGTQLKKPMGYASVAITIDNSDHKLSIDYDEVTVSRRVYRSGESEYRINGTNCRLKDVQELFFDTGIGKEGYSIIGQGQIEKILSGKPEERRELFDEAAGIVKFKKRKSQAMKDLEKERDNLTRIKDILAEQERQIGPLRKQSEKAHQYLMWKDELKDYDASMFLLEYERLANEWTKLKSDSKTNEEDISKTNLLLERSRQRSHALEEQQQESEKELDALRKSIGDGELQKKDFEANIMVYEQQIRSAKDSEKEFQLQLQRLEEQKEQAKKEQEQYLSEQTEKEKELASISSKATDEQDEQEKLEESIAQMEARILAHQEQLTKIQEDDKELSGRKSRQETLLEQNGIARSQQASKILTCKSLQQSLAEQEKKYQSEIMEISDKEQQFNQKILSFRQSSEEQTKKMEQLRRELDEKRKMEISLQSKLDALKNLTERYEGYGFSIQKVMEQKNRFDGIVGTVSDILNVKKEYETAMEIALGGNIRNIVTRTENTAKQLIIFLKKNKYGRATFLPMDRIKSRGTLKEQAALKEEGALGIASTLVDYAPEYKELVEFLLGQILIVDHMDHATAIARKYQNRLRIVTLEGELLSPGGSISGGSFKNSSNLLGRQNEIEQLEKDKKELPGAISVIQEAMAALKEEGQKSQAEFEKMRQQLQEVSIQKNTLTTKLDGVKREIQKNDEEFRLLQKESKLLEEENTALTSQVEKMEKDLRSRIEQTQKDQEEIDQVELRLRYERDRLQSMIKNGNQAQMGKSLLEQELKHITENLDRVSNQLQELEQSQKELLSRRESQSLNRNNSSEEIEKLKQEIAKLEQEIQNRQAELSELSADRERLAESAKSAISEREELQKTMIDLEREKTRLETKQEKNSENRNSLTSYMNEEYELSYQQVQMLSKDGRLDTSLSYEELRQRISKIKNDLRSLGDVNVNAVEDFRELSQRYELYKTNHDDLVESEQALLNIIDELDTGMREQFKERFAQIQEQFLKVFRELFGGGKGDLELVDGEDILETGIRINAQPPGKKLQNMMQLSGGEKSLTAIALLFAIQNLKPSPFCLLDEIEAALDDSNVDRFAQYLHKLTKNTQFIVITHRRGTMNAADRLYGITMQEKGISTMVSINLEDAEQTLLTEETK